ncbi:FixH family protein [Muricoccus radiodurans]|uniref:FixH family protein n=1 Tax=Muricoccus radiodurans TaxID=2231721 RepID=UPI003CE84E5E
MSVAVEGRGPVRSSRWIPWTIGAVFLAIVGADAVMVMLAVRSDPGLVAGAPGRVATGYVLPSGSGLQVVVRQAAEGEAVRVEVALRGPDGRGVPAESVEGALQRATHAGSDRSIAFVARPGPEGTVWIARVTPPAEGAWDLSLRAWAADGKDAVATVRLAPASAR